jgi:hypothetical protein
MPNMSKRYGEDREVSGDGIGPVRPIGRLVFDLAKGRAKFVRLLKFKCGSPHRRSHEEMSALGDKADMPFCAAYVCFGPKQTFAFASHMSAFGGKADMGWCSANVC